VVADTWKIVPPQGALQDTPGCLLLLVRTASCQELPLIIIGIILLVIGFIAKIAIIWTIGIIAVVIGVALALLGMLGHAIGGRRHYF
jgi:energy-coupling factor transporter transmembrane protein EcfT